MKKEQISRIIFYVAGLLTLALGIILNTKSDLGVSPIISVSYSISSILQLNFGNMTFALYTTFVIIEMFLHTATAKEQKKPLPLLLGMDLLQLPLSLVFTRFMNLFTAYLPSPSNSFLSKFLMLISGILCTGIGAAMSLDMRIIPNPGDGIVQAIADCLHKPVGFTKNCFDLFNISLTICISLIFAHKLIGIGIGTVLSVLGVGRIIALFQHLFLEKITKTAGLSQSLLPLHRQWYPSLLSVTKHQVHRVYDSFLSLPNSTRYALACSADIASRVCRRFRISGSESPNS